MPEGKISLHFDIDANDFSAAGDASSAVKKTLTQLGIAPDIIRKAAISMYEGEINMVIHARGGKADVEITNEMVKIVLIDKGPGIADIDLAMKEGYSTATDKIRGLGFGAGMGLPNMKKYSDEINVESIVGKGTKVEIIVFLRGKES